MAKAVASTSTAPYVWEMVCAEEKLKKKILKQKSDYYKANECCDWLSTPWFGDEVVVVSYLVVSEEPEEVVGRLFLVTYKKQYQIVKGCNFLPSLVCPDDSNQEG